MALALVLIEVEGEIVVGGTNGVMGVIGVAVELALAAEVAEIGWLVKDAPTLGWLEIEDEAASGAIGVLLVVAPDVKGVIGVPLVAPELAEGLAVIGAIGVPVIGWPVREIPETLLGCFWFALPVAPIIEIGCDGIS